MGGVLLVLEKYLGIGTIATVLSILVGGTVYVISAFAVRAIKRDDILILPKGEKIAAILAKFKLIK